MPSTVILHKFTKSNQSTTQSRDGVNSERKIHYQNTHFITSAPDIRHLPEDEGIETCLQDAPMLVNLALNRVTNQKSLAKTSKTPGRTQLINLFKVTGWLSHCRFHSIWLRLLSLR